MVANAHGNTPNLTDAQKRNLITCWRCEGNKVVGRTGRKCHECAGSGQVVSDLGMISFAIRLQGDNRK